MSVWLKIQAIAATIAAMVVLAVLAGMAILLIHPSAVCPVTPTVIEVPMVGCEVKVVHPATDGGTMNTVHCPPKEVTS